MFSEYEYFQHPNSDMEERVNQLINRLTLDEKIDLVSGDLSGKATKGNERVGIPQLKMADGPVGVHWWCDASTAYPATICATSSWDPALVRRLGAGLGRDGRARGIHILLAPGVNMYRSPLCGRNFEYMGEDPCLAAKMVTQYVRGCQNQGVATTVKHYAVNFQEYNRHHVSSDVDERTLREVYLPAFEAAVRDGGTAALMTAYNLVNGQHCSEHHWLNNEVLRGEWGFDGLVMSDWVSTYSVVGALNGGLDLEMPRAAVLTPEAVRPAVENGLVSEATLDDKLRRLLRVAAAFGWLDREQKDDSIPQDDPETSRIALDVARAGMVLLKNQDDILPLKPSVKKLAVIGYHAAEPVICGGGSAFTTPNHTTSILGALKDQLDESVTVTHAMGVNPMRHLDAFRESAFYTPAGTQGLQAEIYAGHDISSEPVASETMGRLDVKWTIDTLPRGLDGDTFSVRWRGELRPEKDGMHVIYAQPHGGASRLQVGDHVLYDTERHPDNHLRSFELELEAGRSYPVDAVFYSDRQNCGMHVGWESAEAIAADRRQAVEVAAAADAVVVCVGFTKETEREGADRTFALPEDAERLLQEITAVNSQTVATIHAGGGVDMANWLDRIKGLLYVWYPGQEGGTAAAEILLGNINPSGKLPITIEKRLEDRSSSACYHDTDDDLRVQLLDGVFGGYRHVDRTGIEPRFPFGFGLSYTTFAYENLRLSASKVTAREGLEVSFDVVNTGKRRGAEVVQLYIGDRECSVKRPVKELKNFAKVDLDPDERRSVSLRIDERALRFYHPDCRGWCVEPGDFDVFVGASAADIRLTGTFRVIGT